MLCKHQVIGSIPIGSTRYNFRLHETKQIRSLTGQAGLPPNFDIVNGFLNRCRGGIVARIVTFGLQFLRDGYHHKSIKMIIWIQTRLNEAGVGDRVEILGTVDRQQKLDFLRSIDLFALPTIYRDPKGLPVLEALEWCWEDS